MNHQLVANNNRNRFELYNADGSAAAMCGNALRCAAKLAWERRRQLLSASVDEPVLVVDTPAGTR